MELPLRRTVSVEQHEAGDCVAVEAWSAREGDEPAVGRPSRPGVTDALRLLRAKRDADTGLAGPAATGEPFEAAAVALHRPDVELRPDEDDALATGGFGGRDRRLAAAARRENEQPPCDAGEAERIHAPFTRTSRLMSRAFTECVMEPEERRSTPVSAISRTFSIVTPPDASVSARPLQMATPSRI